MTLRERLTRSVLAPLAESAVWGIKTIRPWWVRYPLPFAGMIGLLAPLFGASPWLMLLAAPLLICWPLMLATVGLWLIALAGDWLGLTVLIALAPLVIMAEADMLLKRLPRFEEWRERVSMIGEWQTPLRPSEPFLPAMSASQRRRYFEQKGE